MISKRLTTAVLFTIVLTFGFSSVSFAEMMQMDSADFAYKYEFGDNENPTDPAQVDEDGNTYADWGAMGKAPTYSDGVMHILAGVDSGLESLVSTHLWHNLSPTMDEAFTIEFKSHAISTPDGKGIIAAVIRPAAGTSIAQCQAELHIGTAYTKFGTTVLDTNNNTDGYHVFRFAKEAGNNWWIWRDGVLLNSTALSAATSPHGPRFLFGDVGTVQNGASDTDYIRIDDGGAYAPVPEPSTAVLLVCGLAGILGYAWRKRN